MIVIDASVTLAWFLLDNENAAAAPIIDRVLGDGAVVPQLWRLEVANVLQMAIRRGKLTTELRDAALGRLAAMAIEVDDKTDAQAWAASLALSDAHALTTYDAAYLELAIRRAPPIATLDHEIIGAARAAGVEVLP